MDFAPDRVEELGKWYATEHLPGLGSVPGCVHTRRYMSAGGHSVACYDLVSGTVTETPQWLKWRSTPEAERMREHYRNMKRGMFRAL